MIPNLSSSYVGFAMVEATQKWTLSIDVVNYYVIKYVVGSNYPHLHVYKPAQPLHLQTLLHAEFI